MLSSPLNLPLVAACLAFLGLGLVPGVAQEGTPPGGMSGLGRERLLQAAVRELPEPPAIVRLRRLRLDPGASLATETPPGIDFAVVETGRIAVVAGADAVVLPATGERAGESVIAPSDVEIGLSAGDRIAFPAGTPRGYGSLGEEAATLLVASILPADETTGEADAGVTIEPLGEGTADALPEGTAAVTLERFTLAAGAGVPAYSGPVLLAVETGGFALTLVGGDVQVSVAGRPGARPTAGSGEMLTARAGDALFFPSGMEATPPLEGEGEVVLLRFGIVPIDAATPEAGATFPVGTTVVVTRPDVRLRDAPSLEGAVLAGLAEGQLLTVTGPPEEGSGLLWYPVADPNDPAAIGYVAAEFLAAE